MEAADAAWHLVNFFAPAVGVALIAALAAKLLWRGELKGRSLRRLWTWGAVAGSLASIGGLVWFGQDGRMATYLAMAGACALGLLWAGWGRQR